MKKNKPIATRRDLCQFIESLEKKSSASKRLLFPDKHCTKDILYLNCVVKKDVQVRSEVKRKYFGSLRILIVLSIILCFVAYFLLALFAKHAYLYSSGRIEFGYIGKIADYTWVLCFILFFLSFFAIFPLLTPIARVASGFDSFLYWYKENIKKRTEWEVNQLIDGVRVPKYRTIIAKIFGVWMVYVRK